MPLYVSAAFESQVRLSLVCIITVENTECGHLTAKKTLLAPHMLKFITPRVKCEFVGVVKK